MNNYNLNGLNNIKADKELIDKAVSKVMKNTKGKTHFNAKKSVLAAASLALIVGAASVYFLNNNGDSGKVAINNNAVPESSKVTAADKTSSAVMPVTESNPIVSKPVADKAPADSGKDAAENNVPSTPVPVPDNVTTNTPVKEDKGINIPAVILKPSNGTQTRMVPLVVYKEKIYTGSNTKVDPKDIKNFLGERIGKTKNSIDEWNVKDKSSEELASNIGEQDIYTVKGYDNNFRIMSYSEFDGQVFAQFFDCLNGITIKSGQDIFGKLNLVNNIETAKYRSFDDWNNGIENYANFKDLNLLNEAVTAFNTAVPHDYESVGEDIDNSRNNNEFREITLNLKDGSEVTFTAFKNGYIYYGFSNIYFKVDNSVIDKLWANN